MDPIHAILLPDAILWEAEGDIVVNDGTKVGCTRLTTLKRIPIPAITLEQRVTFAIKCALHVYKGPSWVAWARAWLANTNRDAYAAATNAAAAAYAYAYADAAAYAAADAADAADAATYATYTAYTAADAAAYTADAAAYATARATARAATYATARAAAHAADADVDADFAFVALIAKEVCNV
jgi:hypothetical protein